MSRDFYNATFAVLGVIAVIAIAVAAFYLITGLIRWRQPDRNRRLRRGGALVGVFCLAVVAAYSILYFIYLPGLARQARSARYDPASLVKVGDIVPSFKIAPLEGKVVDSDALRGKVVLLNFFATWCGPCIQELSHIEEIWKANKGRDDFALLVIGREETDETVGAFRTEHGLTFPIAADPERSVYSLFAKEFIPRTYLIGRDGTIRFATIGFYEDEIVKLKTEVARELGTPGRAP